jgi:hypothetical protein
MRGNKKYWACGLIITLFVALTTVISLSAKTTTIEGTVNDFFQVITDDVIVYDISDDEKGAELAQNVGKRVKVTGEVEIDEGILESRTIIVSNFQILPDEAENVEEAEEPDESVEEAEEPDESVEEAEEPDESVEEVEEPDESVEGDEEPDEQVEEDESTEDN